MLNLTFLKTYLAAASALCIFSQTAQATLTSYTSDGKDLVYSSFSNVTWTKDANLLGNLIANQGYNNVVRAIIAVSPVVANSPNSLDGFTGSYNISETDFSMNGMTSWFGALAYLNYLNSINYGGSSEWYLPTTNPENGDSSYVNGIVKGGELAELHSVELYDETTGGFENPSNYFNVEYGAYWYGTETSPSYIPELAWAHLFIDVRDVNMIYTDKTNHMYAWAVSPNQIMTVPETESLSMLLLGLGLAGSLVRFRSY